MRVATFQRTPRDDDLSGTLDRLISDLQHCEANEIALALFPECYLQGYSTDPLEAAQRALSLDGESFQLILEALPTDRTTVVLGVIEKRSGGLYNTAVVIEDGTLKGTYSKTHPNETIFTAGVDYPVFECSGWRFGINICYDANFSAPALELSQQGAELLCYPLNNMMHSDKAAEWREQALRNLQKRAKETGCWVMSSDVVGRDGDKLSYGCSCIVQPDGTLAARVQERREGCVSLDLI